MVKKDPRLEAYIGKSAPFAKPILNYLRAVVHEACPDVEEMMKWSFPHFQYHGMLCGMAAFKEHCTFGFWKGSLVLGDGGPEKGAMGQFGRIASPDDLPPKKKLVGYIKKAMKLNEEGVKSPPRKKRPPKDLVVPDDLLAALKKNKKARETFEGFSPSRRREYAQWISEAKQEATRQRRLATALEWLAEGKSRNWKYENC